MKLRIKSIIAGLTLFSIMTLASTVHAAGNGSFALSPASSSVNNGSTTTVVVYENDANVNVVTVTFSYDSSKLQLVGDNCASTFPFQFKTTGSGTNCSVNPGSGTVSGSNEVTVLSFKAIATGTASIVVNGYQIASTNNTANDWNGIDANASITIITPPAPTSPGPSTSGKKSSGSSTASNSSNTNTSNNANSTSNTPSNSTTNNTNANSNTKSTSGKVKGASTTDNVGTIAIRDTAKIGHTMQIAVVIVALLAALAATYWFFRTYAVVISVKISKKK